MAPSFGKKVWQRNRVPEDGRVITDTTYDQLKRQLSGRGGSGPRQITPSSASALISCDDIPRSSPYTYALSSP